MSNLGLPVYVVINALYRQIIINKKIPFEMKKEPIFADEITEEELYKILADCLDLYEKEGGVLAKEIFERKGIEDVKYIKRVAYATLYSIGSKSAAPCLQSGQI